jgi:site-specific DNA recombinase
MIQSRTRTATAPKKHLFTNILYCKDCQKGMWYKANQKGYRCGGNIKYGDTFCQNKVVIREKELMHEIMKDLQTLFNSLNEENFMNSLIKKLNVKKVSILKELENIQNQIEGLKHKKLEYVNLFTENIISKDDLVEYRELSDKKIKDLNVRKAQLDEKLKECEDKDYSIHIGNKLKEVLNLNQLTPTFLHSLVNKITCTRDETVHIQYSFVNPLQEI